MAQQTINIGTAANDGTGDSLRSGATKINSNFSELYTTTNGLATVATSGSYNDLTNQPTVPTTLSSLTNVATTAPTDGQVLKYNSTDMEWQPQADATGSGGATSLDGLNNVTITTVQTGQVLKYNGTAWVNSTSGISLTDLSAGVGSASGVGSVTYNNSSGVFTYNPPTLAGLGYTAPTLSSLGIGTGDVDFGAYKITYANVYSQESDLPSAATYHGMFAHVHGTGKAYYAHAGNWEKMITESTFKTLVAASTDFADFQTRVAAM